MIKVTAIYNDADELCGFRTEGHAGFEKKGKDIVCAAVSTLSINTANSIEALTNDKYSSKQEDGLLELILVEEISKESSLLLSSFFLGIKTISDEYGDKFVKLII